MRGSLLSYEENEEEDECIALHCYFTSGMVQTVSINDPPNKIITCVMKKSSRLHSLASK